ncbi:putative membrane protein [Bacteroides uniformis str. 3978 T3 i]|nr:putative membrane protein [Bacteroides uniformis str. 3978 T3 ii]KDS58492.1 putative membrane protein [Bacteroides uniformis str. 3978 T3 i]
MNNIDRYKNVEIFLNIFNGITIAFITFIIAFTFRNKILG